MARRWPLLTVLVLGTGSLFAAAPPLGPDKPLTVEQRRELVGQLQQAFSQFQMHNQSDRLKEAIESAKAVVALQDPAYVAGVRKFAGDADQRRTVAYEIMKDPAYAVGFSGSASAARGKYEEVPRLRPPRTSMTLTAYSPGSPTMANTSTSLSPSAVTICCAWMRLRVAS